ncbi:MAG TPA: prenyltransferase/squalene oxidase repeat-containing protein [Verrucomicrobiae bacterium]|jgi:squalene-hopene/tetraprenyl-beta-curcumene cyclase|nr:prenyltransferase/squalene oxidase repeat-containing protein [Verrucomicrobiae bacterium]
MKRFLLSLSVAVSVVATPAWAGDISFRHEVEHAIDHGLDWLKAHQNATNGSWSTPDQPALTALALTAFMGDPSLGSNSISPGVQRGYEFIQASAKPDGAIYNKGLQNYNTALCVMALVAARNPAYAPQILRARQWLLTQQVDSGGVGYGDHGPHSDMNNTFTALEALYYSKPLAADKSLAGAKDLNWPAAIHFIQSCQNLGEDAKNRGGFIYDPTSSKAPAVTNASGKVALRSYGSISYAGLLSYIYCDVPRDDARITAVYDWSRDNFTLDENPGMGQQGLYYYLHLMAKALTIYGTDRLTLQDGRSIDWRHDLAMKLLNLQQTDGSWSNPNNRWWEHDPALVTSYSLLSLEMLHDKL